MLRSRFRLFGFPLQGFFFLENLQNATISSLALARGRQGGRRLNTYTTVIPRALRIPTGIPSEVRHTDSEEQEHFRFNEENLVHAY